MTSQHTPGPWTAWACCRWTDKPVSWDIDSPGYAASLARVQIRVGKEDEAKANARLIAAAPDLLNALMVAAIHLEGIATGKATKASDFDMAYIKAAIAKAKP